MAYDVIVVGGGVMGAATAFNLADLGVKKILLLHHWAGRYNVSPDWNPMIGGLPGKDGLLTICGSSGGGFKLAPCIGLLMAELIVHGEGRTLPVDEFSPSRFATGQRFRNAYGVGAIA